MKKTVYIILFICIFLSGQKVVSQDTKFFHYKGYDTDNGLTSSNIRKIIQDQFGFIWIATQDGLNRFDGKKFIQINANNLDPKLRSIGNEFVDLLLDTPNNVLWALTSNGGLNKIDLVTCCIISTIKNSVLFGSNEQWGGKLAADESSLFILSNTDKLATYNIATQTISGLIDLPLTLNLNSPIDNIYTASVNSNILFLRNGSIMFLDSTFNKTQFPNNTPGTALIDANDSYYHTIIPANNQLIVGTQLGLMAFDLKKREFVSSPLLTWIPDDVLKSRTRSFYYNYPLLLFANASGLIIANIADRRYQYMLPSRDKGGLKWIRNIFGIHCSNSTCWIGSQTGLMVIPNIESPVTGFSESIVGPDTKINHCYNLFTKNDSTLFACASDGAYKINLNTGFIQRIDNTQPYYQIFNYKNQTYFSGTGDLRYLAINSLLTVPPTSLLSQASQNDFIVASVNYKDSLLFLGSYIRKEVYQINLNLETLKILNTKSSPLALKNFAINNFYVDKLGRLLIICDEGISVYDVRKQQMAHYSLLDPETNSLIELMMDGCETENNYYFAVYGKGIVETDKNFRITAIISQKEGITNQGIYKIYNVGDSLLITGSHNGLFFYNLRTKQISAFTKEQGLHSNGFDETSGFRNKNLIFLGGNGGFTKIDVSKIKTNNIAPKVYFSSVEIKTSTKTIDTFNLLLKSIKIPNNILQANIHFSTINYLNSEKTTIAYKIVERHSNWINIGTTDFLTLIGISPGTYRLQVKAINEDGIESEVKELTLIFLPKWYQTWWFKVLVALVIASVIYGLYKFRINHLKKEEKIRNQVAADLHDELGSTLNSVKVYTNLAMIEKNNTSHLEKIKEATQSAISGVKDIIWVLDDKRDTIDHLLGRINQFARPICEAAGISYKQQSGGNENYKLGKEEKRNLYMIIKESINNSIKYGECSVIELLTKNNGGKLSISISDDGKGFDKKTIVSGYGLKNIMRRSEEINYHAEINSSPGNGTLIYLEKK